MRFFSTSGLLLSVAGLALLAPSAAFAQSAGDQFESSMNCSWVNSYAEYCYFMIGVSSITIDSSGNMTVTGTTDPVTGFLINVTACEDEGNGSCQPPFQPEVSAGVTTELLPWEFQASAGSSIGEAQATIPGSGTLPVIVTGNYQVQSLHWATFDPGSEVEGNTQAQLSYCPAVGLSSSMNLWLTPSLLSTYLTGIGTEDVMQIGSTSGNLAGMTVDESISVVTNSCPPSVNPCNATGLAPVGLDQSQYTTFGYSIPPLANSNQFYDEHVIVLPTDVLGAANMSSCQILCAQTYSSNGCPSLTSYVLIKWLDHSQMSGLPISVVTMSQ